MSKKDGFKEFSELLQNIGKKVNDINVRREALDAMAKPILSEAQRLARTKGIFENPTGNLADNIDKEWSMLSPNEIHVGWTNKGYYGRFLERGYLHYAKRKKRVFIKKPHLRPAYNAKKTDGAKAAVAVLREALEGVT